LLLPSVAPPFRAAGFTFFFFLLSHHLKSEIFNLKFLTRPSAEGATQFFRGREGLGKKDSAKRHRLFTLSFEGRNLTRASLLNFLFSPPTSCTTRLRFGEKGQF
jgi:hypothetical protein